MKPGNTVPLQANPFDGLLPEIIGALPRRPRQPYIVKNGCPRNFMNRYLAEECEAIIAAGELVSTVPVSVPCEPRERCAARVMSRYYMQRFYQ